LATETQKASDLQQKVNDLSSELERNFKEAAEQLADRDQKIKEINEKLAQEQQDYTQFKRKAEQRENKDDLVKILVAGI
jgi:hypothetical protein